MLVVVIVLHILTRLWSNSVTVGAMLIITCRLASSTELDNYTVNHKNVSSLFLIITLAFLGRFLYFLYGWKREGILYKQVNKIYHFTLTVPPHYLVKQNHVKRHILKSITVRSIEPVCNICRKSSNVRIFQLCGSKFIYQASSRKKNFRILRF